MRLVVLQFKIRNVLQICISKIDQATYLKSLYVCLKLIVDIKMSSRPGYKHTDADSLIFNTVSAVKSESKRFSQILC